jgi:hypothetical protein
MLDPLLLQLMGLVQPSLNVLLRHKTFSFFNLTNPGEANPHLGPALMLIKESLARSLYSRKRGGRSRRISCCSRKISWRSRRIGWRSRRISCRSRRSIAVPAESVAVPADQLPFPQINCSFFALVILKDGPRYSSVSAGDYTVGISHLGSPSAHPRKEITISLRPL